MQTFINCVKVNDMHYKHVPRNEHEKIFLQSKENPIVGSTGIPSIPSDDSTYWGSPNKVKILLMLTITKEVPTRRNLM